MNSGTPENIAQLRRAVSNSVLVALFAASGFAGLIYESLWSRYLGLFVGHAAYAQIIVLVIFLGGMAVGAYAASRWSTRVKEPLFWYAAIELVVGLMAFAFHGLYDGAAAVAQSRLFPLVSGAGLGAIRWIIAALLILPQSLLLGATFPLMSAGLLRRAPSTHYGRLLALLYFANSFGAAAGALIAGLWLITVLGLPGTMTVAGLISAGVGIAILAMLLVRDRSIGPSAALRSYVVITPKTTTPDSTSDAPNRARPVAVLLLVAFGTAVASFVYEIAWIRMLSLVFGSSSHSFEIVLSAFILGLALGALWIRNRIDRLADPLRTLGHVQWAMGVLAVLTLPLYLQSYEWMADMMGLLTRSEGGYRAFVLIRYCIAMVIMLPATVCAGMTLPLITHLVVGSRGERAIGTVYALNTLGSIVGVVLAGLLLMPLLGLKALLLVGGVLDIALGVWLLHSVARRTSDNRARFGMAMAAVATIAGIAVVAWGSTFSPARLASGVFRTGRPQHDSGLEFLFYRDGRTASVSVARGTSGALSLSTNGKVDASVDPIWLTTEARSDRAFQLSPDDGTQLLLPLLALAHHPAARELAVIGHGSGVSSHVLLGSPFAREVVTLEIEPMMVVGSRLFWPANRRVLEDRRSRIVIDDARAYFAASGRRWDLIMSEPSNPWVSGASSLFTVEFYQQVKRQLAPGGVFAQWLQLYELNDPLAHSVLAALDSVFESYEVFYTSKADIVVVASNGALPEPNWDVVDYPAIREDLDRAVAFGPEWFETLRLGGRSVLSPLLRGHRVNSDYFPILEQHAERARFMARGAIGYTSLPDDALNVIAALSGRKLGFGVAPETPTPDVKRPAKLAAGTRLRARLYAQQDVSGRADERTAATLYRHQLMDRLLESGRPPGDWQAWLADIRLLSAALHGGTSGVADPVFHSKVRRYLIRAGAPVEVRAAIDFMEATSAWDWSAAAHASRRLLALEDRDRWIPRTMLRDGALTAFIMTRDTAAARGALERLNKGGTGRRDESLSGDILVAILNSIGRRDPATAVAVHGQGSHR